MQYGILIGRFQPLHSGHQAIINEIMHDGLTPVIIIGSSDKQGDKNPLSYCQRAMIINDIYGGEVVTLPLPDNVSNVYWGNSVTKILISVNINPKDCVVYYHYKDGDFDIRPLLQGFKFKDPTYFKTHIGLSSTNIRHDLELHKNNLDGRVYKIMQRALE